jgi:hypothetical protein
MNQNFARQLRTLLILGRVSNLPTVWSDCLAGWWLSGGGNVWKLPLLFFGVSALYTGGMFLNDAFDADFDRQRRASRPIPSGAISQEAVLRWSLVWLGCGAFSLIAIGKATGLLALALLICIIIYDASHKAVTASPWLMGLCRFWVYVIAGTTAANGLHGNSIWCGVALAFYIVAVLKSHGELNQDALARRFARRFERDPDRGYGSMTRIQLREINAGAIWRDTAANAFSGQGSMGNGGAMRAAPLGAYFADDLVLCADAARNSALVTHTHPEGVAGTIAVAMAAAMAW